MAQLPQGMSEDDYDAIEAAVTETVRGRWFLREFARRNRSGEMREILDAVARLEGSIGQAALPADPSVRLLMQRVKEIGGQLDRLAHEMRGAGLEERFAGAVAEQGRAVAGMMRGPALPPRPAAKAEPLSNSPAEPMRALPSAPVMPRPTPVVPPPAEMDPRLGHLEAIDRLPMAEKLALFA